jgi:hypothetical protein
VEWKNWIEGTVPLLCEDFEKAKLKLEGLPKSWIMPHSLLTTKSGQSLE